MDNKIIIKLIGFIILLLFGLNIIIQELSKIKITPSVDYLFFINKIENPFIIGLIITLSNPLTILFWIGVFTSKIIEKNFIKNEIYIFGIGALIPTIIFLNFIIILGVIIKSYFPEIVINILNIMVGIVLIVFSFKILIKK